MCAGIFSCSSSKAGNVLVSRLKYDSYDADSQVDHVLRSSVDDGGVHARIARHAIDGAGASETSETSARIWLSAASLRFVL